MDFRAKCRDCGAPLALDEEHYYEYRCEGCEGRWHARIQAWRAGKADAELDAGVLQSGGES